MIFKITHCWLPVFESSAYESLIKPTILINPTPEVSRQGKQNAASTLGLYSSHRKLVYQCSWNDRSLWPNLLLGNSPNFNSFLRGWYGPLLTTTCAGPLAGSRTPTQTGSGSEVLDPGRSTTDSAESTVVLEHSSTSALSVSLELDAMSTGEERRLYLIGNYMLQFIVRKWVNHHWKITLGSWLGAFGLSVSPLHLRFLQTTW